MISNKLFINRDLGVPVFSFSQKRFWETAAAGALINGIGSLFGSGASAAASKAQAEATRYAADKQVEATQATNEMNYKIASEANANNYKMFQEQNQWNLDQWNRENEYNSASQQRQRLEDAGLNPYLMMNGGNAGTASSITSASPTPTVTPTMQTPDMSLYAGTGYSGLGAALGAVGRSMQSGVSGYIQGAQAASSIDFQAAQTEKVKSETAFQNIVNAFEVANRLFGLAKGRREIKGLDLDNFMKGLQNFITDQSKEWLIMKNKGEGNTAYAQGKLTGAMSDYADQFAYYENIHRIQALNEQYWSIKNQMQNYKLGSAQYRNLWLQGQQIKWTISNLQEENHRLHRENVFQDELTPGRLANALKEQNVQSLILDNKEIDERMSKQYGKDWRSSLLRNIDKYSKTDAYDFSGQVKYGWNSMLLYLTDLVSGTLGSALGGLVKK